MSQPLSALSCKIAIVAVVVALLVVGIVTILAVFGYIKPSSKSALSANWLADDVAFGSNQPHMRGHPMEEQARAIYEASKNHPDFYGCYAPAGDKYSPGQELMQENPALVPPYQQALKSLPAMRTMNYQQEFPGNDIGPNTREGIDTMTTISLDTTTRSDEDDFQARVQQTEGVGVSNIYRRGDGKGIALINQKSRMVDPTKMLPNVDPSRQSERMVQAGPSIADIGCRVPKAADIMRLLRASRG